MTAPLVLITGTTGHVGFAVLLTALRFAIPSNCDAESPGLQAALAAHLRRTRQKPDRCSIRIVHRREHVAIETTLALLSVEIWPRHVSPLNMNSSATIWYNYMHHNHVILCN